MGVPMAMKHAPADSTGTIPAGPPVEFRLLGEVEAAVSGRSWISATHGNAASWRCS
ncbi:hypothetical protein ACFSTC_21040 [Nonomuraea ferruginea]